MILGNIRSPLLGPDMHLLCAYLPCAKRISESDPHRRRRAERGLPTYCSDACRLAAARQALREAYPRAICSGCRQGFAPSIRQITASLRRDMPVYCRPACMPRRHRPPGRALGALPPVTERTLLLKGVLVYRYTCCAKEYAERKMAQHLKTVHGLLGWQVGIGLRHLRNAAPRPERDAPIPEAIAMPLPSLVMRDVIAEAWARGGYTPAPVDEQARAQALRAWGEMTEARFGGAEMRAATPEAESMPQDIKARSLPRDTPRGEEPWAWLAC